MTGDEVGGGVLPEETDFAPTDAVSWSVLPSDVQAKALNQGQRFRGVRWYRMGRGAYAAFGGPGNVLGRCAGVLTVTGYHEGRGVRVGWYDLPTFVKGPVTQSSDMTRWAKSLAWYRADRDHYVAYEKGVRVLDLGRE